MKLYQILSWKFLKLTYGIFAKRYYNIKCVKHQEEPDAPYLLLANHYYHTDPFFIAAFLKSSLHYLGSDEMSSLFQQVLGHLVGLIYIKKGQIDTKAVRELFKYVKRGDSVAFFPEGDGSWDGETNEISENIVKLVRMLNIPLVTVNISGAYLTKSRWAAHFRLGKILVQFRSIKKNEIDKLSDKELYLKIKTHLYNNELKNKEIQQTTFKGKNLAKGIQYLLWKCPDCQSEDTIYGSNNEIICSKCKSSWILDANMRVSPEINKIKDLKDWSDWQKKEVEELVNVKEIIELTKTLDVRLKVFNRYSRGINKMKMIFVDYSQGTIILERKNLIFLPYNKNKRRIGFKIKNINSYVDCVNKFFRFSYDGQIYQLEFGGKNSSKYISFLRALQKENQ